MLYEHSAAVSPKPKTLNDSYQKESIMNSPNANQPMIYTSQKKPLRLLPIVLGALGVGIVLVVLAVAVGIKIFHGFKRALQRQLLWETVSSTIWEIIITQPPMPYSAQKQGRVLPSAILKAWKVRSRTSIERLSVMDSLSGICIATMAKQAFT